MWGRWRAAHTHRIWGGSGGDFRGKLGEEREGTDLHLGHMKSGPGLSARWQAQMAAESSENLMGNPIRTMEFRWVLEWKVVGGGGAWARTSSCRWL